MSAIDDCCFFNIAMSPMTDRIPPQQARHVFNLLGGRTEASRILGWPLTKIDSCLRSGWIHGRHHREILESAWGEGIKINELDFVVHLRGLHPPVAAPERSSAA